MNILPISELTTDASSTITKLVGEMNGMMILLYPCIIIDLITKVLYLCFCERLSESFSRQYKP